MNIKEIYSSAQLVDYIHEIGFLPLLYSGIRGFSAEEVVSDDCRYVLLPDGGWDWPLWKWKGEIVREGGCVYGKFFDKKAGFISREWWPSEDAGKVRQFHHTSANGMPHHHRGFCLPHRQARSRIWLGVVTAYHSRKSVGRRGLPLWADARGIKGAALFSFQKSAPPSERQADTQDFGIRFEGKCKVQLFSSFIFHLSSLIFNL